MLFNIPDYLKAGIQLHCQAWNQLHFQVLSLKHYQDEIQHFLVSFLHLLVL
jgi:hypothetical protein